MLCELISFTKALQEARHFSFMFYEAMIVFNQPQLKIVILLIAMDIAIIFRVVREEL